MRGITNRLRDNILRTVFESYKKKQVKAIVLFGSRARGDHTKNSDYDVNVLLNLPKEKKSRDNLIEKNVFINYLSSKTFNWQKKKGHPFLYCTFRDGTPLYQNKKWFDKNKLDILELSPTKEIVLFYLKASAEKLLFLKRMIKRRLMSGLEYEDLKVAANQLGFGIMIDNSKYPTSPHTLKKELIALNEKHTKVAKAIYYLQETYYKCKIPKIKTYRNNVHSLRNLAKEYLEINHPKELKKMLALEKAVP